ncbi:unnamed protein product, partial [Iphiclides podalirius]
MRYDKITYSAPSMPSRANELRSVEDENKEIKYKEEEALVDKNDGVLKNKLEFSRCNTGNSIQLNENNAFVNNDSSTHGNDSDDKECEPRNNRQSNNNLQDHEKISTLKEVIEHVISNKAIQKQPSVGEISSKSKHSEIESTTENHEEEKKENIKSIEDKEEIQENEIRETASPSQSDCSRATRWEALADMAAELPPSLTIDPITGHIYALSK